MDPVEIETPAWIGALTWLGWIVLAAILVVGASIL